MNKNVFSVATNQPKKDYSTFEYKKSQSKQAELFWDEVIALQLPNLSDYVRWDIFEENFVFFLLEKMNFSNDLLNKINWKNFLTSVLDTLGEKVKETNETPQPPSNPALLPKYKGLHVRKERFSKYVSEEGFF